MAGNANEIEQINRSRQEKVKKLEIHKESEQCSRKSDCTICVAIANEIKGIDYILDDFWRF